MTDTAQSSAAAPDLDAIVTQTQAAALRLLDPPALTALQRDLRGMKDAAADEPMRKTLAKAVQRIAAERRRREGTGAEAAADGAEPTAEAAPAKPLRAAAPAPDKAERKRIKEAEQAEKQRVKELEKAERRDARKAEKQAERKAAKQAAKPDAAKGPGKGEGKGKAGGKPGKAKAGKPE